MRHPSFVCPRLQIASPWLIPLFDLSSSIVNYACFTGSGSSLEVTKVLPLLIAALADHPSFHVVAPSLPGYAWSEGVQRKGFMQLPERYAEVCVIQFSMYYLLILISSSLGA